MPLHESETAQDVAPLIAATDLELAAMTLAQDLEVLRLQQGVGELSKREALFVTRAFATKFHGVLVEERIHREVNADFAKEINDLEPREPLTVVDELRSGFSRGLGEQANDLLTKAFHVSVDVTRRKEDAIRTSPRRVADEARCSTDEDDGRMPRLLKAPEHAQCQEMTDVERIRRRIKSAVHGQPSVIEPLAQRVFVGTVRYQSSTLEICDEFHEIPPSYESEREKNMY